MEEALKVEGTRKKKSVAPRPQTTLALVEAKKEDSEETEDGEDRQVKPKKKRKRKAPKDPSAQLLAQAAQRGEVRKEEKRSKMQKGEGKKSGLEKAKALVKLLTGGGSNKATDRSSRRRKSSSAKRRKRKEGESHQGAAGTLPTERKRRAAAVRARCWRLYRSARAGSPVPCSRCLWSTPRHPSISRLWWKPPGQAMWPRGENGILLQPAGEAIPQCHQQGYEGDASPGGVLGRAEGRGAGKIGRFPGFPVLGNPHRRWTKVLGGQPSTWNFTPWNPHKGPYSPPPRGQEAWQTGESQPDTRKRRLEEVSERGRGLEGRKQGRRAKRKRKGQRQALGKRRPRRRRQQYWRGLEQVVQRMVGQPEGESRRKESKPSSKEVKPDK